MAGGDPGDPFGTAFGCALFSWSLLFLVGVLLLRALFIGFIVAPGLTLLLLALAVALWLKAIS